MENRYKKYYDILVNFRKEVHQEPELSFQEYKPAIGLFQYWRNMIFLTALY